MSAEMRKRLKMNMQYYLLHSDYSESIIHIVFSIILKHHESRAEGYNTVTLYVYVLQSTQSQEKIHLYSIL